MAPHALGATARVRLQVTDGNSNVISRINVGEPFLLRAYVSDLRPNARGVFSVYLDVEYRPASLVRLLGPAEFAPPYATFGVGDGSVPGLVDEIGSFGGLTPTGAGEKLLFSLRFRAEAPGRISFEGNPADESIHGLLLYGSATPVLDVEYVGTTLEVGSPSLSIDRIEFRPEGTWLTLSGPPNLPIKVLATSNLNAAQWQIVSSDQVMRPDGTAEFLDVNLPRPPTRFYRAQQAP